MSESSELNVAVNEASVVVHLTSPLVAEDLTGTLVPVSGDLLQRVKATWLEEFERRATAGIVDDDYELWRNGYLRDSCLAAEPTSGYALVIDDEAQGIVLFDSVLRHSRTTQGVQVLYVRYLATAPWNRQAGSRDRRYGRVGRALVKQAVRESIRCGSPGRVGVHSVANAAPFFEKLSFQNLGTDALQSGLVYFELKPVPAFSVLTNAKVP